MRSSKTGSFDCVVYSAIQLKPNAANILLFNFCELNFIQHAPITIAIDCNGHFLLIFEEKWPNYASRPKAEPTECVRVFCALNVIILLVYIPAKIKMSLI